MWCIIFPQWFNVMLSLLSMRLFALTWTPTSFIISQTSLSLIFIPISPKVVFSSLASMYLKTKRKDFLLLLLLVVVEWLALEQSWANLVRPALKRWLGFISAEDNISQSLCWSKHLLVWPLSERNPRRAAFSHSMKWKTANTLISFVPETL